MFVATSFNLYWFYPFIAAEAASKKLTRMPMLELSIALGGIFGPVTGSGASFKK